MKIKCIFYNLIRKIEEKRRQEIAKDFESTVNFLIKRNNNKKCLTFLDELKYIDRNPFVESVTDAGTPFTKGREHKLTIRLIQSNYRIKKNGEIFSIDIENDISRCKSYEFFYSYYKPINKCKDTEVKLYYYGYSIDMHYNKDKKTYIKISEEV